MESRATLSGRVRAEVPGLLGLALPIVVGMAASTLIGVTDSLMVAPLGAVPLAAVGVTGSVLLIIVAAIFGLLSALAVRIGAAFGAGQGRRIALILRNGLVLGAMAGVAGAGAMGAAWFLLPHLGQPAEVIAAMPAYWAMMALFVVPFAILTVFKSAFEAIGRPWLGTGLAFLGVVLNVPLNFALIWGIGPFPELGLTGAGVASVLAETLALSVALAFWARARSMRRLRLRSPLDLAEIGSALREGAPLGLLYIAETGAMAVATLMIGTFGAVALAGNQVAMSVGSLLYMVPLGMAGAVAIRVAQARGAAEGYRLRAIVLAALSVVTLWMAGSALLLALRGAEIAALITADPEVITVAAAIFAVFAVSQVMDGLQSSLLGALRGLSDTAFPATVSLIAYWVIALPVGWWLARLAGWGPSGVWMGFVIALAGAATALLIRFWRQSALAAAA
jgi:multidrug resistance protein, MATE family